MNKFPIFTILALIMLGLFFFLYIMFNYAFHNPVTGAFTLLDAQRPDMLGVFSDWGQDILNYNHNVWGLGFVCIFVVTLACLVIDILRNPKT